MGSYEIRLPYYVNDVVLISETENDFQRLLQAFRRAAQGYNMEISKTKTKYISKVAREPTRCKLAINDSPIEKVMMFDYFRYRISGASRMIPRGT
ncbi:hypothetical protein EAI_03118 [Harpegnathos saltator]|uniref:Reverse transcriptase domain-containing protein n=1 Tax=Harpegnathos saltator TaxID=610380 RepID=E2BPD7_HARSA|nr:hypothetical protein EAI_03118 [Harpegnathos saltator]